MFFKNEMLWILVLLLVITVAVFYSFLYFLNEKKTKKETKSEEKKYFRFRGSFWLKIRRFKLSKKIDSFLRETGYFHTTEIYILIHLFLLLSYVFALIFQYRAISNISLLLVVAVNVSLYFKTLKRKNKIRHDLANIQDLMYFQSKIGTNEAVILTNASKIASDPLKEYLEVLSTAPKVKYKIEETLEEFRNISNIPELQTFSFILEQRQLTGRSDEGYLALAKSMKRSKRLKRKMERERKRMRLVLFSLALFVTYVLMISIPLFVEISKNLEIIFR
ncbi:MAG: hypothetical protein ACLKAL_11870 [Alkaliphilus sp.]